MICTSEFGGVTRGALRANARNSTNQMASRTANVWNPQTYPNAATSMGDPNAASDCPMLPAPYTPRAVPCWPGGYHPLLNATPTEKLANATPIKNPKNN